MSTPIQITSFTKDNGPLTKRIAMGPDGNIISDGSACTMSRGNARRLQFNSLLEFGDWIRSRASNEALTLGVLRPDLPDVVEVVTKSKLNGAADVIARTQDFLSFCPGQPTFVLLDHDTKGMPAEVRQRIDALGGFWRTLTSMLAELEGTAHVERCSTSAGLYRTDTDDPVVGSAGVHIYLFIKDGADGPRFLKWLHDYCWRAGLGWFWVGRAGQLLERSIVDHLVGTPEHLVFEGRPVLAGLAAGAEPGKPATECDRGGSVRHRHAVP